MRWRLLFRVGLFVIGILAIGSGIALYFSAPAGPGLTAPELNPVIDDAVALQPKTITIPLQNSAGSPLRVVGIGTC